MKLDADKAKLLKAEVDKKVAAGETRLSSIQNEINAQERVKAAKIAEIGQIVQRKAVELRDPLLKQIAELESQEKALNIAIRHDQTVAAQRADDLRQLTEQIESQRAEQSRLAEALGTFVVAIGDKQREFAKLNAQVLALREVKVKAEAEVHEVKGRIEPLEALVTELEERRLAANEAERAAVEQHETTLYDLQVKIKDLDSKYIKLRGDYQVEQRRQELERAELAKRIMAADSREQVLKLRERKASETERFIQDNAELLNL